MSKYIANKLFNDKLSIYVTECLSTNDFLTNLLKRNNEPLICINGGLKNYDFQ